MNDSYPNYPYTPKSPDETPASPPLPSYAQPPQETPVDASADGPPPSTPSYAHPTVEQPVSVPDPSPSYTQPPLGTSAKNSAEPAPPSSIPSYAQPTERTPETPSYAQPSPPEPMPTAFQTPPLSYTPPVQEPVPQPPVSKPQPYSTVSTDWNTQASAAAPSTSAYQWPQNSEPPYGHTPKKRSGGKILMIVLSVIVIFAIVIGIFVAVLKPDLTNGTASVGTASSVSEFTISPLAGNELLPTEVYKKVIPSVVGIQTYSEKTRISGSMLGEGSGVIMSADGYIITNTHVIASGDEKVIMVILNDGKTYEAKVVGLDAYMDLSVIKIEATDLTPAEFGDSASLEIGNTCYAIGNPGGQEFAGSMTNGIISGVDRQLTDETGFITPSLQTNAAINPGNSGGALVNGSGQVIGITSSKIAGANFEAMGFAIPMHEVQPIVEELIKSGSITGRPRIGITYKESAIIDEAAAELYGIPTGILVDAVDPASDAAKQGLKSGDIIHSIDGQPIASVNDIQKILKKYKAGDTITAEIYRPKSATSLTGGETFTITFKLMEQSDIN